MTTFDEKELKTSEELTSEVINEEVLPEETAPNSQTQEDVAQDLQIQEDEGQEALTLEDLELDVSEPSITFTATLHFEFSDIFNAIEHIEQEPEPEAEDPETESETESLETESNSSETELETGSDIESESEQLPDNEIQNDEAATESRPEPEADPELVLEPEIETETVTEPEPEPEVEPEPELESESEYAEPEFELEPESEPEPEEPEAEPEPAEQESESDPAPKQSLRSKLKGQDTNTKKLLRTDLILFAIIAVSIIVGLVVANSLVDNAKAANEQKIAEMQANIKEVKLADSLYNMAANQVIDDVAVPTYSMDELYALDLREKTGFTANDLAKITRKGLVGCEEAFVKAEETYGVNSIFLISIASLESAHGTMMFRPNNMFGYGRTGFSSKEECIMTVAKGLGTRYLPPGGSLYGGSPTLKGVNKRYAANPQWYYKVGKYMQGYYAELAAEKNSALDKFE